MVKGCLIFLHREVLVDNDCCRNYRQKYCETIPDGVTAIGINAFAFKKDESRTIVNSFEIPKFLLPMEEDRW